MDVDDVSRRMGEGGQADVIPREYLASDSDGNNRTLGTIEVFVLKEHRLLADTGTVWNRNSGLCQIRGIFKTEITSHSKFYL